MLGIAVSNRQLGAAEGHAAAFTSAEKRNIEAQRLTRALAAHLRAVLDVHHVGDGTGLRRGHAGAADIRRLRAAHACFKDISTALPSASVRKLLDDVFEEYTDRLRRLAEWRLARLRDSPSGLRRQRRRRRSAPDSAPQERGASAAGAAPSSAGAGDSVAPVGGLGRAGRAAARHVSTGDAQAWYREVGHLLEAATIGVEAQIRTLRETSAAQVGLARACAVATEHTPILNSGADVLEQLVGGLGSP